MYAARKRHRGTASEEGEARFRSGPGERGARACRGAAGGERARAAGGTAPRRWGGASGGSAQKRGPGSPADPRPQPAASQDVRLSSISVSTGSVVLSVKLPKSCA